VSKFLERVEATIDERGLLARGSRVLVAVSGGVDSMVLLHALHSLAGKHRWKIFVAHFNHRLRGKSSDADESLVREASAKLGLPCFCGAADVKQVAAKSKISVEMAARKLRHEFLARTARENQISNLALAHHADDQVELFFLRMFRGSGGEGMAGMKWRSTSPADKAIGMVRPLLEFSKAELTAVARENKLRFRVDATNASSDFLRNRVRNELLPLLRDKFQPGIDKTVLRLMEIAGAESEFVRDAALRFSATGGTSFDQLPVAVQRKVLQLRLNEAGLLADFELIEQLRKEPGKRVSVGVGLTVARNAKGEVGCTVQPFHEHNVGRLDLDLSKGRGTVAFAGRQFRWRIDKKGGSNLPHVKRNNLRERKEFFDADKIGTEIILRHWQPGDRFQPIGLRSATKLQDLFMNAKIPAAVRRELVVATTSSGEIFWVEGLRISERFKLTSQTRRQLRWQFQATVPNYPTG